MRKLKFFSLFALIVFSATVWAAETEGPWTYVGMRSGTCDQNMNNSISYNNLDNSHWGTVTFWNYDNNGIGFVVQGSSKNNSKNAVYSLYSLTKTIPSYSRCQITWKYQVKGQNVKHYSRTTLYEHTNQSTLQAMAVDFTLDLTDNSGSGSRIYSFSNKSFEGIQTSGTQTRSYDFNNLTGTGNSNVARYLLMTHVSVANEEMKDLDEWGSFLSVSATETWTYRAIFTFDANGGTGTMNAQTIDNTGTLTANAFTRTGYTFSKWTANKDGSGSVLGNKASVTASSTYKGPKTLYAQWTANKYTVTLNNQSATTAGSTSVEATYNAAMPKITIPTRTGYTFGGYYTEANGKGTQYIKADGTSAKNWDKTANTTLYAKWTINTYSISYNLDGGVATNPTEYTVETETFTLNNPTKEGYTFTGWTGSNGEEPQTEVSIVKGSTENKSYTANWTVILKPCELSWKDVPEGGVVGTIGHEDEIQLPQVNASQDFISAFQARTATLRLGSTDESVLAVYGFNNFAVNGVGECDVYVVHDEDAVFAYDSAAFHVTVNPEPAPEPEGDGKLTGAFTINADGDQILFSKGNLQYQASTTTLRFATNQYDTIGGANINISDTYTGWIDLFGWGTGNHPAFKSEQDEDYSTFTDWGVNAISNGGNEANLWRTLTIQEWGYLIQTRTNAADLKGQATVAGVHGYVLLPDSWILPAGLSFTASPNNWTTNVYTAEQWTQMEAAGAVFLPATGYRNGSQILGVDERGGYWSSDVVTDLAAYYFEFNETTSRVFGSRIYFGQPVRLVTAYDAPTPEPTPTVWTALKVGDVIKVGDKIEVPAEGDGSWGINGNVLRNAWGPYTLIRADIYQASDFDDPEVTETEDGAFYVFKAENSDFYPLSYLGKSGGLVVTMTSDGLVVTAAENKEFTVAVHENGSIPTAVENVQTNHVQATKFFRDGMLLIERDGKTYNVVGTVVR